MDQRDNLRPLNYRGRVLEGAIARVPPKDNIWKNAGILREGRTEPATQVSSKELIFIETADESAEVALSADDAVQGGKKVEQIGACACTKILSGMLDDLQLAGRAGVFIIDAHMNVGNMFDAFTAIRSKYNFPIFYVGASDDENCVSWFFETKQDLWVMNKMKCVFLIPEMSDAS